MQLGLPSSRVFHRIDPMLRFDPTPRLPPRLEAIILLLADHRSRETSLKLLSSKSQMALTHSMVLYNAMRVVARKPVVVDASKDARRLKALFMKSPQTFRLIHLVRDGRAVAASSMRRLGMTMRAAARLWSVTDSKCAMAAAAIPPDQQFRLKYEDLCEAPRTTLGALCTFIGVPFHEAMLEVRPQLMHSLGGNPMRYRTQETTIRLDERWKHEIKSSDLRDFEQAAGTRNRMWGYS